MAPTGDVNVTDVTGDVNVKLVFIINKQNLTLQLITGGTGDLAPAPLCCTSLFHLTVHCRKSKAYFLLKLNNIQFVIAPVCFPLITNYCTFSCNTKGNQVLLRMAITRRQHIWSTTTIYTFHKRVSVRSS